MSTSIAQSFDIAQYRQAFMLIADRLKIPAPDWKFGSIVILTADILHAIDDLATGKTGPADAGTDSSSSSGESRQHPEALAPSETQVAFAPSETTTWAPAPPSALRSALEGAAITLDLELPFAEDDTQLALDIHAEVGRRAAVDADARMRLTDDLAAARLVVNRIAEMLCPGQQPVSHDALVERVQAWTQHRVMLQRRVAECYRGGLPHLAEELSTYVERLMTAKEFFAWWKSAKFPTRRGGATPGNPVASDGWPVRESTIQTGPADAGTPTRPDVSGTPEERQPSAELVVPGVGNGPFTDSDLVDIADTLRHSLPQRVGGHVLRTFAGAALHRSVQRRFARWMNDYMVHFASDTL